MKRWFVPRPVFFKREFNRTWPFLVGFTVTGTIITKFSLGLTGTIHYSLEEGKRGGEWVYSWVNGFRVLIWVKEIY
ncbi:hypothetical protein GQ457_03G017670 [Hibiscus cannabinus]